VSVFVYLPGPDGRTYRFDGRFNLRTLFPAVVEQALNGLLENTWEPWYGNYLRSQGVTPDQLVKTWECFGQYASYCLEGLDQKNCKEALDDAGFLRCPEPARLVVLAKIGQLMTATMWLALREGTHVGEIQPDIVHLKAVAKQICSLLLSGGQGSFVPKETSPG
jgi:hypothetical protein